MPFELGGAFYINLNRRPDRRAEMEGELERMGIAAERFSAIDCSEGAIGCMMSQLEVLTLAKERGYPNVLILEDDFTFLVEKDELQSILNSAFQETDGDYDVIMLSYSIQESTPFSPNLLEIQYAGTASGYIVHSRFYTTLITLCKWALDKYRETYAKGLFAYDVVWRRIQEGSRWFATSKRIGMQRASFSDIEGMHVDYKV
jgi:glycosyl transferase family 25